MDTLETLEQQLEQVLLVDRPSLRRQWQRLQQRLARQDEQACRDESVRLAANLERARLRRQHRDRLVPPIRFDVPLPILNHRLEIQQALEQRQTLVVAGETGSGKSTQLPKICLDAGLGRVGLIGHTQPRRIAARSIAARLAEELSVPLGQQVGYKIRFQDKTDRQTLVKLMTDGVLLAETQSDRFLEQYEVIILDEAHERSLNIDFLLGYLRQLLARRPDLHLIITSATIDAERFSAHFADALGPAPIIEVSGRGYPVEVRYRPLAGDDEEEDIDWTQGVMDAVHEVARIDRGDVLVFLPTERDIREMARRLRSTTFPGDGVRTTEILPLYARLSAAEQNRIFQPSDYRRIVLATNVAESSLTVPNVRYVVDTGTARISRYSPRSKIVRLPIEPISQASANQRAGRCGRVAPGICIRLYDESDYLRRDPYTTPEIRRTNLAAVILQAKALRLGEIEEYPFLDPPRPEAVRDGYKTLFEIQAIDRERNLTEIGRQLSKMPVDPRIGRMILAGAAENCLHEVLIVAAALELQDPRERPHDRQQQADQRHERFLDKDSDFVSYLKIWDFYHQLKETTSRSKLRKACQDNYLSYNRLREWTDIHRQLQDIVAQNKLHIRPRRHDYAALHRSLLAGLLSGVAYRSSEYEYSGAGGVTMYLWPGSGLLRQRHAWIMAAERVETSRRYARTVARISPKWVEPLAEHLVKRSYSDPHWSRKSRTVMAYEKVSLMGMPIVVRRSVPYGNIDPVRARRIFIQEGMVDEQAEAFDSFMRANQALRKEIEELAARTRRREYLLDDYSFYSFYDERLPPDVYDVNGLRRLIQADSGHRERLTMKREDLIPTDAPRGAREGFPDELQIGGLQLPVRYNFSPGSPDDGVTISVPSAALNQLTPEQTGWLVPGLIEEKVVALIRSLPKSMRRNFVPVPDTARQVVADLEFGEGPLLPTLARMLGRISGEIIQPSDFHPDKLPDHLRMNIEVIDDQGAVRERGRDLVALRASSVQPAELSDEVSAVDQQWHRDGITAWDFGSLPVEVTVVRAGISIAAYPALIDRGQTVDLRLLDSAAQAQVRNRRGISRLYLLGQRKSIRTQIRWLPRWNEIELWATSAIRPDELQEQVSLRIAELAFIGQQDIPRDEAAFMQRLSNAVERIAIAAQEIAPVLPRMFEAYQQARSALEDIGAARNAAAREDLSGQLRDLFAPEFLVDVPWNWLNQYPRYLAAMVYRIDKLKSGGQLRDAEGMQAVEPFVDRYRRQQAHNDQLQRTDPALTEYRWMIEEFRVSLFAQQLGTVIKISPQRLEKQWAQVETY